MSLRDLFDKLTGPTAPPDPNAPRVPTDWAKLIHRGVTLAIFVYLTYLAVKNGTPLPAPPVIEGPKPQAAAPVAGPGYATGWVSDPAAVAAVVAGDAVPQFQDTPAGRAAQGGDEDVYLWEAVRKVNNRSAPWYPNVNQLSVGCCVGCGYKHSVDALQAVQILGGAALDWKPVSVEAIYAFSRVEVGGGRLSGDGSLGAWAGKGLKDYGTLPMERLPSGEDLSTFSPEKARRWGATGVPDALEPLARDHVVKGIAQVKTWAEVKKAIRQGYPVPVCSDQGFTMQRDATGTCRPSGTWAHCMAILGVRTLNGREQGFILNSWGDDAHTGPRVPDHAPAAGFWADAAVIGRMAAQGDTFALSDAVGFPARRIDWFSLAQPYRPALALLPQHRPDVPTLAH